MKRKDFLATLKAMADGEAKDKLLKAMEEGVEDDDDGDDDEDADGSMEKCIDTSKLSKALDTLEEIQGQTPPAAEPLSGRLEGAGDVGLAKSLDGTGFVKSLVEQVSGHADDLGAGVAELSQQQAINNDAVLATGRLVLGLVKSLDGLTERIERLTALAGAPAAPRTVTATPMAKSFGDRGAQPAAGLSKGQLANVLNGEIKKSMDAGDTARAYQIQNSVALVLAGRKDALATEIEANHLRQAKG